MKYSKPSKNNGRLKSIEIYEGESIETKCARVLQNNEPITDTAPIIYTAKEDGVLPAYNIRTDRFDIAMDAYDSLTIDQLRFVEESDGSIRFVSDATLLLNEQRIINDIGEDNYRNFIRELQVNPSSPYKDGNFTDEQLMTEIKSRYVQSPSEVREWVRDMLDQQEKISDDAKAKLEDMKSSGIESSDTVVESVKTE